MEKVKILILDYFTGEVTEVTVNSDILEQEYDGDIESYLSEESDCYHNSCEWFVPHLDKDGDIIINYENIQ